ncbi:kinase-like protein [Periconia macrospinosa]|uniref:Kinase-like protein n=1 Tax=Periconia macrospinosa TaxID=97972 RepID=A0A2V1ED71_9PLEO|nr:kinase-like protein [Periconia macrospinosa]
MSESEKQKACSACGWTSDQQSHCSYASSVKLFYGASVRGVWSLGSDFVLKERPADPPTFEAVNTEYVKANTTIPIPEIAKDWTDRQQRRFILAERIEGENLQSAWPTLSQDARVRIAEQTAEYIHQLRKLQSEKMASLGDAPIYSGWLFLQGLETPHGPFGSDEELWQSLSVELRKLPEKAQKAFRKRLPPCAPYTFTHGDLTTVNIMVKDDKLAAIIDWESAGYFPVWWEFTAAGIGLSEEDVAWKALLRSKMQPFEKEREFWRDFYKLCRYPELDDRGKELMEELLNE